MNPTQFFKLSKQERKAYAVTNPISLLSMFESFYNYRKYYKPKEREEFKFNGFITKKLGMI
jgi:hypothetical protein